MKKFWTMHLIENGFFQDGETARESFIPAFDYEGVRKMP